MKEEKDYIQDIAAIRTMMERSSKFLSLSGWAGIMAGIYALVGVWVAYYMLYFNPNELVYQTGGAGALTKLIALAVVILLLALGTAVLLSHQKANKRHEKIWNATSKQMLLSMGVPLVAGGLLVLILIANDLIGLVAPFTLIFYGLALYNASRFTYAEIRILGLMEIVLGLVGSYFIGYGLLCWAIGFGLLHVATGIYLHYRYER